MEQDHLEILLEDINGKFDLVLEGHETLRQQIEKVGEESKERDDHLAAVIEIIGKKLDRTGQGSDTKVDAVARDLADHRRTRGASVAKPYGRGESDHRDTEVYGPMYVVNQR